MIKKVHEKFAGNPHLMAGNTVRSWMKRFRFGDIRVEDNWRGGRPKNEIDGRTALLCAEDPYIILVDLSTRLGLSWPVTQKMLFRQNLQKISGMWVPREQSPELRERRIEFCRQLIEDHSDTAFLFFFFLWPLWPMRPPAARNRLWACIGLLGGSDLGPVLKYFLGPVSHRLPLVVSPEHLVS